jgi:hypothetical protein
VELAGTTTCQWMVCSIFKILMRKLQLETAKMVATKVGSLICCVIQIDNSTLDIVMNEVKYLPDLCVNPFSVYKAIKNGFDLSNEGESISLTYESYLIGSSKVWMGQFQETR